MRALAAIVLSWLALTGLWLLYVGQHTKENAVAGAIAAALALGLGVALARLGLLRFRFGRRRLGRAAALPWDIVRDFGLVTLALVRGRPGGELVELDAPARSAGDRALVGLLGSIAPNAYVVDLDRDRRVALVHVLDREHAKGAAL
jgi:multisubunit Na+/H+ antiporter MnhE subunit